MWSFVNRLRTLCAALALIGLSDAASAAPQSLSPQELRGLAARSIYAGAPAAALEMTAALLARDAEDVEALILRSRALRDLGQYDAATKAGRTASRLARSGSHRYASAVAIAQALSSQGKRTRAQLWLRRAGQYAPTPAAKELAKRDFRYLKSRNRWSTQLSFNLSPSSNVSNGADKRETLLYIHGVPILAQLGGAALALSGTEISGGATLRYRLAETQLSRTTATFAARHSTYALTDRAKALAPGVKGSDFRVSSLYLGLGRERLLHSGRTTLSYSAAVSRAWYGGQPLANTLQISGGLQHRFSRTRTARIDLRRDWEQGLGTRADATRSTLSLGLSQGMGRTGTLHLSLAQSISQSASASGDYRSQTASARLDLRKPVLGASLSFGLSAGRKDHDRSNYHPDGQHDRNLSANVTMVLPKYELYGFVPTVRIETSRTSSDVDRFDTRETGIRLGIQSSF